MIDWIALGEEPVDVLRRYLMVDTTNPPVNESAGARFLAGILAADGISSEIVESAPGRRVHGNDERVSLENLRAGVRSYTEMLLAVAGA